MTVATTVKLSKIFALAGLRGMDFQDLQSIIQQTLDHPDCTESIVLLDVRELWHVVDLKNTQALQLLHQRLGR